MAHRPRSLSPSGDRRRESRTGGERLSCGARNTVQDPPGRSAPVKAAPRVGRFRSPSASDGFPAPRIVNSPPLLEVAGGDHQPCDQRDEHQYVEPERSLVPPERRFGLRRVTSRLDVGAQGEFIGEVRALADGGELWVSADREGCHLFLSAVASSLACRHSEAEE